MLVVHSLSLPEEDQEWAQDHSSKDWDVSKEVGEERIHILIETKVIRKIEAQRTANKVELCVAMPGRKETILLELKVYVQKLEQPLHKPPHLQYC